MYNGSGQVHAFADTDRDKYFCFGIIVQSIAAVKHGGDLCAQIRHTIVGCIMGMALVNGANACLADMFRRDEVWLTNAERNNLRHCVYNIKESTDSRRFDQAHTLR